MDSSPVDEAWETDGADPSASDPPPSSEDHRSPVDVIADLRHPHLIYMQRSSDGPGFQADLAGGMSLAELSRSDAGWFPLPLRVSLRVLLDALSGLAAVHQASQNGKPVDFVHGELAPSNIIVGRDGRGRLIPVLPAHWNDRAQANPDVTGYIAPERLLGDVFGQSADVFSAGVLLWEAITGKPLFRNWPLDAIVTQLIGRKVPYPIPFGDALWGVPLADVAMRALLVDPAERWNHVGALGAQIETIARGHLASSDEIAALVAGFAAGIGSSVPPPSADVVVTLPPPAPVQAAVTSLAPTVNSIQSPPPRAEASERSVAPVEVPALAAEPVAQKEQPPHSSTRIWLPMESKGDVLATQPSRVVPSSDVADSWSGVSPRSVPGQRRTRTVVLSAIAASAVIAAFAAYHLLDRAPESRASATVLAPKGQNAPPGSAAAAAAQAPVVQNTTASHVTAQPQPSDPSLKTGEVAGAASVPAAPTSIGGSSTPPVAPPAAINRVAPRPAVRPTTPSAPPSPPANAAPRPVAPPPAATPAPVPTPAPAPPAAPKPKPKEDIFGI